MKCPIYSPMKLRTRTQAEATAGANAIAEARVVASRELGQSHAELHNALKGLEFVYRNEATEHERRRRQRKVSRKHAKS